MCIRVRRTFTITEEFIKKYAILSGDLNPIHLNHEEAQKHGFKAPIAHGMLTMGLIANISASFTKESYRISSYEMHFHKPVFQNDDIHIIAEEQEKNHHTIQIQLTAKSKEGIVVTGQLSLKLLQTRKSP